MDSRFTQKQTTDGRATAAAAAEKAKLTAESHLAEQPKPAAVVTEVSPKADVSTAKSGTTDIAAMASAAAAAACAEAAAAYADK